MKKKLSATWNYFCTTIQAFSDPASQYTKWLGRSSFLLTTRAKKAQSRGKRKMQTRTLAGGAKGRPRYDMEFLTEF